MKQRNGRKLTEYIRDLWALILVGVVVVPFVITICFRFTPGMAAGANLADADSVDSLAQRIEEHGRILAHLSPRLDSLAFRQEAMQSFQVYIALQQSGMSVEERERWWRWLKAGIVAEEQLLDTLMRR